MHLTALALLLPTAAALVLPPRLSSPGGKRALQPPDRRRGHLRLAESLPSAGNLSTPVGGDVGPIVVTEDGRYRTIANWETMTGQEREVARRRILKRNEERLRRLRGGASTSSVVTSSFMFQGFKCAVRFKPAAPGFEDRPPLLLLHPIGIGLASWFWEPLLSEWRGAAYAPDFVGCGASDAWDPAKQGLFVPLDWVRQCEALWRERIRTPVVVVAQGGLAPIAVRLASRETDAWSGRAAVRSIVLASPPTWRDIADGIDSSEVQRNYGWLSSPLGGLGYRVLRSRAFVQFFSNLFLFAADADATWLDEATSGATLEARWPVFVFNAGTVGQVGLDDELRTLPQPTLVLSGEADRRVADRREYAQAMAACRLVTLAGCNVLPWESPSETSEAIAEFAAAS